MALRGLTKGVGGSAIQGLAGVAAFYAHRMLSSKVAFVQNHALAVPAGFLVLGHVLKSKPKFAPVGNALIGAGGYAGAQAFELSKAAKAANTPAAPAQTSGFDDDTGALTQYSDIGALTPPSDIGAFGYAPSAGSSYDEAATLGL
jgi:hypothetical protein